ncbi:MAG TPA: permease prefix domain 1-containing protein, partial [Candidatus Acidoferrales bacterium]
MTAKRRRFEREMDEELRAHVEAETEENIRRGMTQEEARRRALAEFGGVEQIKEEARELRWGVWLETLWQDLRYAARMLRKAPGFTAVAVLTLALGIGANTAIFSVVYGVLLRPLPYPQPEQLVFLSQTSLAPKLLVGGKETPPRPGGEPIPFSPPNFVDFREQASAFASIGAWAGTTRNLTGGEPERINAAMVTSGF